MKRFAPAAERNREPIQEVLERHLPEAGLVLEVASGTGQHAVWFAERFGGLTWQPSDPDPAAVTSIEAHRVEVSLDNLRPPLSLDVTHRPWPLEHADVVLSINMIHISPFSACEALFEEAGRILTAGGLLITYGPYAMHGVLAPESNRGFDESLRSRNPAWGIRDVDDLDRLAEAAGLARIDTVPMPANNHTLVFRKG